jgi:hypothetical protein
MKTQLFTLLLALAISTSSWATAPWTKFSPALKADASIWRYRNKSDLRKLILKYADSPRESYYIINQSQKIGLDLEAANVYQELQFQQPRDDRRKIIYAYAAYVAAGPGSRNWFNPKAQRMTNEFGIMATLLSDAVKSQRNSPELLTMVANMQMQLIAINNPSGATWASVLGLYKRAIKLNPTWADSYYGACEVLFRQSYSEGYKGTPRQATLLKAAEAYGLKAQEIDPGLRGSCARLLSLISEDQKQLRKQLKWIDVFLRTYPSYKSDSYWGSIRQRVADELAAGQNG